MATAEPPAPSVLAVVVTSASGPGLDATLAALAAQDYPRLGVLVVDAGSGADPTPRVREAMPDAVVRRTTRHGFAAAADEALVVESVQFFVFCRDDVMPDPAVVRLLVEEAYRSNAAVVGPKLVDADEPEMLLEVGRAVDRFGAPHTGIEPGELDQEQHDAVRDVFYVSSALLLVRADLFRMLDGFDAAASPGAEDLDLCWRARLAGARVMVAPDARVRRRAVAPAGVEPADAAAAARNRVRAVLTSYSLLRLLWIVPAGVLLSAGEAVVATATRRPGGARAALGAWWWNLRHLGEVRGARRRAQALRRVHDRDLRELQVRGSAQVRAFVAHRLPETRIRGLGDAGRSAVGAASAGARQPVAIATAVVAALFLVGSRDLLLGRVPAVGTLARWPGVVELLDAFASGWRYTGLGSSAAAPPAFPLMAALGVPLLGAVGLARTLVSVGAIPLGAVGAYRLARPRVGSAVPAVVTALVYGASPVPRNALAGGRLGPLVLFALGPFVLALVGRAAGDEGPVKSRTRLLLGLAVLIAVATAWYPAASLWLLAAAAAVTLAGALVGGVALGLRMICVTLVATAGALVLLVPWPLDFVGADAASLGFAFRPDLSLSEVLRFETGPSGAGWTGWGTLAIAALPLAIATGPRLAWAGRAWVLALGGFALVWAPARFAPEVSVPAPEAALSLAALGLALASGLGVAAALARGELRRFRFGWRQPVVAVAGAGIVAAGLGFAADALDGRWHAPARDWGQTLSWMPGQRADGGFRVLWLGDPLALPLDPATRPDGLGWVLTRNGPGDGLELWRAPLRRGDHLVGDAVGLVMDRRTNRLGHMVAPMAVRYVAVPDRPAPIAEVRAPPPAGLTGALAEQTDLVRLGTEPGLVLYENAAWAATRATAAGGDAPAVPLDSGDPLRAALRTDLGEAAVVAGELDDSAPTGPGTLLWSEAYDADWSARARGRGRLEHVEPFGLSNGYVLPERARTSITYGGQAARYALVALQSALWLAIAFVWWSGRRRRARPAPAEGS